MKIFFAKLILLPQFINTFFYFKLRESLYKSIPNVNKRLSILTTVNVISNY